MTALSIAMLGRGSTANDGTGDSARDGALKLNKNTRLLEALAKGAVISATTTAQPVSPSVGDLYIIPSGKTGAVWSTYANGSLALYAESDGANAWFEITPKEGMRLFARDSGLFHRYNGSVWNADLVFDVVDHGASTSASNNYAAVNLAIAALTAAGGGTLYVPEGNFDIDLPSATGLSSFPAGTRVKGAGRYATTITINTTTTNYLNAFGNSGDIIFEDLRIVFNLQDGQTASLLVLASNTEFYRCDIVSNNAVVADDDTNNGIWINVPESGTLDWLVLSDCTWSGWHYPLLRTNTSTAVLTNTFVHNCQAYDNGVCHLEFNSPTGSWSNIYITNLQMGDQSGTSAGVGFGIGFASCENIHINGLGFVGTTDGEAVHVEEAHVGFTLTDFYIDVTSDESGEGDGIVLLNNNIGGSQASPANFAITNGVIKRSGSTGGHGLWLLDTTGTTPLTNGVIDNIVISGFTADENLHLQTSMESITVGHIVCDDTASIAAAATVDLGKAKSDYVNVTGSGQSITALGKAPKGVRRVMRFNGANTFTHNGTSLILPGSANITTAADDTASMVSLGSGNWLCDSYKKASGQPVVQIPISTGVSGLGTGIATFLATPSSANLAAAVTDEDGTGSLPLEATGTFTPAFTCATPGDLSVTYGTQSGYYTKIGRLVVATFEITTSALTHSTASGSVSITGLPFTSNSSVILSVGATNWAGITKANYTQVAVDVNSNASTIVLVASGSGQALSAVSIADVPSGGTFRLRGTIIYTT